MSEVANRIPSAVWRNSQLSIARFYGGCKIQGQHYTIDPETDDLVREDVYRRELRDRHKQERAAEAERDKWLRDRQTGMFDE